MRIQKFKGKTVISSSGPTTIMEELEIINKSPNFISFEYEAPPEPEENEDFVLSAE